MLFDKDKPVPMIRRSSTLAKSHHNNSPTWLKSRIKPKTTLVLLLLTLVCMLLFISLNYPPPNASPQNQAKLATNPGQEVVQFDENLLKILKQMSLADPKTLESCISQHATNTTQTTHSNTTINQILHLASSQLSKENSSNDDAKAISDRAVGQSQNAKLNAISIKQAQEIVDKVDLEIKSHSDNSTNNVPLKKPEEPLVNIKKPAHIEKLDLRFPGSSIGSSKTYGIPVFGYLGRERGNFEPIVDSIAPRTEPLKRRRGLLAVPVSESSKQKIAPILQLFHDEKFDVMLFHYDNSDWSNVPNYDKYVSVRVLHQTKFWFAKRFLVPSMVDNYDYLFLWDDDIGLKENWSPIKFISILQNFDIHAAQPALDKGTRRNYPQFDTVRLHQDVVNLGSPGRFSDFIEVMFPIFSREAWQNCIWETIPFDGRSFWGMDNAWYPHCSSMGYCRFAIIDIMPVDHLDMRSLYQPPQNNMREFGYYTRLYKSMCTTKPSQVEPSTMFRIFVICNFLRRRPLGLSFKSLMNIDVVKHGGRVNSTTCPESTLWPGVANKPWFGDQESIPVYWDQLNKNHADKNK